ncbi:VCBS repeat-containing protein [Arcicella aquatica]|uniref:VCBS repeat-containing protein n=1 Tax=Arcicella aquatica TaxID=217141 RepID=A0ABU5QRT5_9BACT|nr:VCBS repeat-containing protein [Arcicella aquatica]MEA5259778.1 VCBS repeat-containing protein [Arcicella aquatica]
MIKTGEITLLKKLFYKNIISFLASPLRIKLIAFLLLLTIVSSCTKKEPYAFELLEAEKTGIDFSNDLTPTKDLNIFTYMYFYNGGGVGAGDFNNDGLVDLCFTANLKDNKIYLNRGGMKFEDITEKANFKGDKGWSNGVSVVDINQDGKLDIYVSQVGDFESLQGHNLLFVCKEITKEGIPVYEEKAEEYGLDLVGFGTQAAFFDNDLDGDLDMFQLNHSVHQNGTFGVRKAFQGTYHPLAGDKFFRNDDGKFVEVAEKVGVKRDALGYGLGIGLGDVNFDGYPDMYVGNDFHENDYLYINQKNGTFLESIESSMMHTSQFSMGVDLADINNDHYSDIISLDMLPYDREILKRSEGEDSYNTFRYKLSYGYNYQFSKNNLQLNNGNGTFSEIGLFSGVYATDWSWSPLFVDFDNDGQKDLFVSNGIPKRMNDIDYINFISNEEIQRKMELKTLDENDILLTDKLPEIKIPNKFFINNKSLEYRDAEAMIGNNQNSYSNGALYADLDNDGDLDIVTNNINQKAFIYENKANEYAPNNAHVRVYLKGSEKNLNAIGAKVLVFKKGGETIAYEKFPVRAFQASMEIPLNIGLGNKADIDSTYLIWPDRTYQKINLNSEKDSLSITYRKNLPVFDYEHFKRKSSQTSTFSDIAHDLNLDVKHQENEFNEFEREALIPHKMSAEGPALAVADINHDGLEDIFIGSARNSLPHLFLQNTNGKFRESIQPAFQKDSVYEEVDAIWTDVNNDTHLDLVVAEGGNEFDGKSNFLFPRIYLNDGKGNLSIKEDAFSKDIALSASVVTPLDFNKDGKIDLFIGARSVPFSYGKIPESYLLQNDGTGKFTDVTDKYAKELKTIGLVKNAVVQDLDKDGDPDLLLALEWDGICEMENQQGKFVKKMLTTEKGWWNFVMPFDFDNDGDLDILAGNLGRNSRLKASVDEPIRMYVSDFDKNGTTDQVLSYYLGGTEVMFANKSETQKQFPFTKKKFLLAKDFAKASIADIVGQSELASAKVFEANYFDNAILVNDGKGNFSLQSLPAKAQYAPFYAAQIIDANGDKLPDVLMLGNFYDCNIQMGRCDADYGTVLINKGNCKFEAEQLNGIQIKGQVKRIRSIKVGKEKVFLVVRNNEKMMVLSSGVISK